MTDAFEGLARRLGEAGVPFRRDVPLAPLTWLGVGGVTPVLAEPRHAADAVLVQRLAAEAGVRLERLGGGANLLVAEGRLPLAVLALSSPAFRALSVQDGRLEAGAGAVLETAVRRAVSAGLAGLEGLTGIPATVGGALAMNAGGRHGEVSDRLAWVEVADASGVRRLGKAGCGFAYRRSALGGLTVLGAVFDLEAARREALEERSRGIRDAKRRSQPLEDASAGCIFRNPAGDSAGRLIDSAGLKGAREGGAEVSERHANFIVNLGSATADDIRRLIDRVRDGVRRSHGVLLELEVVTWP